MLQAVKHPHSMAISVIHDRVPNRIRFSVPVIRHRATYAELLKQGILKSPQAKGIYHAEPNITTATLLVKYHPAFHDATDVIELVGRIAEEVGAGQVELSAKHKNPRLGKMPPSAFFTRELVVSIIGNVLGGLLLAMLLTR
jgi:hypothetical protein